MRYLPWNCTISFYVLGRCEVGLNLKGIEAYSQKAKAEATAKFSLMSVVFSLIYFCSLIFFAFAFAFIWCEYAFKKLHIQSGQSLNDRHKDIDNNLLSLTRRTLQPR